MALIDKFSQQALKSAERASIKKPVAEVETKAASLMAADIHRPLPEPTFALNEAEAFFDREGYAEMQRMVARAKQSVRLEFYLFGGPEAEQMIDTLVKKRAEGVDVKITLDSSMGKMFTKEVKTECRLAYERLQQLGFDVKLNDTRPLPDMGRPGTLDHTKMITVDGKEALVGGMNVASLYYRYHDVMIKLKGRTAAELQRDFEYDRKFIEDPTLVRPKGGTKLTPFDTKTPLHPTQTLARPVSVGVGRHAVKEALIQNVRAAKRSIAIQVCEMGDSDLIDELIAAKAKNPKLDIKVMVDPMNVAGYLPKWAQRFVPHQVNGILNAGAIERMMKAGMDVRTYHAEGDTLVSHLKMSVFDGDAAVVGSTNYTNGGFEYVQETNVELHGGKVIGQLNDHFVRDWARADAAKRPPTFTKFAYWIYKKISP